MATIHISETDAVRDIVGLLARVHGGEEIVIERNSSPMAVLAPVMPANRSISECIALATKHEAEFGDAPVLDADFAADVEGIIHNRVPSLPPVWK